jgi:hypothetical protein
MPRKLPDGRTESPGVLQPSVVMNTDGVLCVDCMSLPLALDRVFIPKLMYCMLCVHDLAHRRTPCRASCLMAAPRAPALLIERPLYGLQYVLSFVCTIAWLAGELHAAQAA